MIIQWSLNYTFECREYDGKKKIFRKLIIFTENSIVVSKKNVAFFGSKCDDNNGLGLKEGGVDNNGENSLFIKEFKYIINKKKKLEKKICT